MKSRNGEMHCSPQNDYHNEMHNYRNHAKTATQRKPKRKTAFDGGGDANGKSENWKYI